MLHVRAPCTGSRIINSDHFKMTSETGIPRDAVVASETLRFRGGRRPFLAKKRQVSYESGRPDDGADEGDREPQGWWTTRSQQIRDWLRSNPLHLGLDDLAVKVVLQMLREGDACSQNETSRQHKCWLHICIELSDVPGSPLGPEDKVTSEMEAGERTQNVPILEQSEQLASPETCENSLGNFVIPVLGHEVTFSEEMAGSGNNALPSPRDATTQTDLGTANQTSNTQDETDSPSFLSALGSSTRSSVSSLLVDEDEPSDIKDASSIRTNSSRRSSQSSHHQQQQQLQKQQAGKSKEKNEKTPSTSRRQNTERRSQRFRPSRVERRKTESDITSGTASGGKLRRAGTAALGANRISHEGANLLSMNLIERQEYLLKRKKEREQKLRDQQNQKESEECTHRPNTFTRKNSFPNIESVIKHDPAATWSESPTNRKRRDSGSKDKLVAVVADPPTEEIGEKKKVGAVVPRQKSVSRLLELAACKSALLDACKLDLMNRSNPESFIFADQADGSIAPDGFDGTDVEGDNQDSREEDLVDLKYRFANNSTADKGKIQLQDHAAFQLDSFYRKRDRGSAKPGVSLLMGRREDDYTEQVVAVLFDRSKFNEVDADEWMHKNVHRFPVGRRELIHQVRGG